jgi:hypothetical protein
VERYTVDVLIKHAGMTETQLVRAVYPDCPSSDMDKERSLIRSARVSLIPVLAARCSELEAKLQVEYATVIESQAYEERLREALSSVALLRAKEMNARLDMEGKYKHAMKNVNAAYNALVYLMTFKSGVPWAFVRLFGVVASVPRRWNH